MYISMDIEYINKGMEYLNELDCLRPLFLEDEGKYTCSVQTKTDAENLKDNIIKFQEELQSHLFEKIDELKNEYMNKNHCTYENIPSKILNAHFGGDGRKIYDRIMFASEELTELLYKRF